jgi:hypothetical protein
MLTQEQVTPECRRVIDRGWKEIQADVKAGIVPATAESFSELHDYVDANGYGGAFEETAHDVHDVDFWNAVQDALNARIGKGGLRLYTIDPGDFTEPQWVETFYASELLTEEMKYKAVPVQAFREEVEQAVISLRSKAKRERGDNSLNVDGGAWARDLRDAANVLKGYLKK